MIAKTHCSNNDQLHASAVLWHILSGYINWQEADQSQGYYSAKCEKPRGVYLHCDDIKKTGNVCDTILRPVHIMFKLPWLPLEHNNTPQYGKFNINGINKMQLGLHIKCLIFLPDFSQIWNFLTDFHKNFQYQISHKSVQQKLCWYMQTDRHMEMKTIKGTFGNYTNTTRSGSLCLDGSSTWTLPNIRNHSPNNTASRSTRLVSAAALLSEHHITCTSATVQCLNCNMM